MRQTSCLRSVDGQKARQDSLPHARQELFFRRRALLKVESEFPSTIGFESSDTKVDAALPSPIIFSVDRVGREDYRVLGKGRDGPSAKSSFGGRVSVSLFRSDE